MGKSTHEKRVNGRQDFMAAYARLKSMSDRRDADICNNPLIYLREMEERYCKVLEVLDRVHWALSPDVVFQAAEDMNMFPSDLCGEALIRCNAAIDILREFETNK